MAIDPRLVLVLKTVVACGSISAGARALGWTQPAVTSQIRSLERSVGLPLLLRRSTGIIPTEAGQTLLDHAAAISAHLDAAATQLDDLRNCRSGTVRLAAFPSIMATLIPQAMRLMSESVQEPRDERPSSSSPHHDPSNHSSFEGIQTRLVEAEPDEAIALLQADETDLAVVFTYADTVPLTASDGFERRLITTEPVSLIVPPNHRLAGKANLTLSDLADDDWVAGCQRCREHLVTAARHAGFEPRITFETDDYVVVQSLVSQGLAVSVLPHMALTAYRSPAVMVRSAPDLTERRIEALFRPGADRVPSVRMMLNALVAAASQEAKQPLSTGV